MECPAKKCLSGKTVVRKKGGNACEMLNILPSVGKHCTLTIVLIGINVLVIGAQDEIAVFVKRRTRPGSGTSGVPWR